MSGSSLTPVVPGGPLPTPALGAPAATFGAGPKLSPVVRLLAALRRFKWIVVAGLAVGIAGSVLATRFMAPTYRVRATLALEVRETDETSPIQAGALYTSSQWVELLTTNKVLTPVVEARKLYIRGPNADSPFGVPLEGPTGPDASLFDTFERTETARTGSFELKVAEDGRTWTLTDKGTQRVERGAVGDSVGRGFGFRWVPNLTGGRTGMTFRFDILTPQEVADDIRGKLSPDLERMNARFLRLYYEGQNAERAAATLNAIVAQFVQEAAGLKRRNLTAEAEVLDTQVTAAKQRLDAAQAALQSFKVSAVTLPREDVPITAGMQANTPSVFGSYLQQRNAVDSLRREQAELREALSQAVSGELAIDRFLNIGAVSRAPELRQVLDELAATERTRRTLLLTLREPHDSVQAVTARIAELRTTTLPRYVQAVLQRLAREQASLEARIQTATRDLQGIPQRTIQEQQLMRELEIADEQYRGLVRRFELSRLQEASSLPDLSILDRAVPPTQPQKNRKAVIIALGTLLGLGAGLGLAFLLDLTDKRFRYADQITSGLGLSILGAVPEIRRAKGETPSAEEAAQVIEAFRSIRLNLLHAIGRERGFSLTISSPMPGDGKSLVSSNLALSFAEAGFRVLLVDGDTRRGELHRTFGVDRRPGLLDHLTDEASLETAMHPTSHPRLTLLTAGTRLRNAPELLGGEKMRRLLDTLQKDYDVVLVDSPPLGAGIDPFVLGTLTGHLMLVVRAGETEREFAEAKLQIIDQLPIRLVGAVLNDVRTTMNEYKYYSYSYGYSAEDESGRKAVPMTLPGRQDTPEQGED
ncbi:MAG TPA: polysaccharide biosynthesis tyrosine autokinase [Gemmatimonadales bacterium]|nr:polysaccharide biosynthesis tyrosine autokinase [Gemmatimonadales bacterium]